MQGLNLTLTSAKTGLGEKKGKWTPASLFSGGVDGVWYDLSDDSTFFIERENSATAATPGDPIGTVLDKSPNANHAIARNDPARGVYGETATRPVLLIDGVDDGYTSSRNIVASDKTSVYIAMVYHHISGANNYGILQYNSGLGLTAGLGTRGQDRVYYRFYSGNNGVIGFQNVSEDFIDGTLRILAFEVRAGRVFLIGFDGTQVEIDYRDWVVPAQWNMAHPLDLFGSQPQGEVLGVFAIADRLSRAEKGRVNQYLIQGKE